MKITQSNTNENVINGTIDLNQLQQAIEKAIEGKDINLYKSLTTSYNSIVDFVAYDVCFLDKINRIEIIKPFIKQNKICIGASQPKPKPKKTENFDELLNKLLNL